MYRFLPEYRWRNSLQLTKGCEIKTLLESIQHCLCSNYAEPSGGVTQICPQAVLVHLYCTVCDMIRDRLKLWVVSLIKMLSSCQLPREKFISSICFKSIAKLKTQDALLLLVEFCISFFFSPEIASAVALEYFSSVFFFFQKLLLSRQWAYTYRAWTKEHTTVCQHESISTTNVAMKRSWSPEVKTHWLLYNSHHMDCQPFMVPWGWIGHDFSSRA